jgi:hypothetical protein
VYVHLLRQRKATSMPFSSLMFFEQRTQSSARHRRLKYLALFSMRTLTVALLALTFAAFFVTCSSPASAGRRLTVLAVDRSLSMKAGDRIAKAKRDAAAALGSVRERAQVIAFDTQVSVLTQPTQDPAAHRAAVESISAGDGRSSYAALTRTLASIAKSTDAQVDAHVYTDVQKSSMPSPFSELALPANVRLTVHPVASESAANWYVERVEAPRQLFGTNQATVRATLAGPVGQSRGVNLSVHLGSRAVETRQVTIPESGRITAEVRLADVPYGFTRGYVRIATSDALEQDNAFPFAIDRKESSRVLLAGDTRVATYYKAALESVPNSGFEVDTARAEQLETLNLSKYALIVTSGRIPASDALGRFVASGGGLLVTLGAQSVADARVPVTGQSIAESRYAGRGAEGFLTASSVDSTHPVLGYVSGFESVKFYQYVRVDPGQARILAKLTDGSPLVVESKVGEGRVLVFASTFDNLANDFPLQPSFVPFIERSARYLSGFPGGAPDYAVGSSVELRSARETGSGVEVIGPEGRRELSLGEAARLETFQLPREGFYEVRRASGRNEIIAAHSDRRESDLAVIPPETVQLWRNLGQGSTPSGGAGELPNTRRENLWWYFLLALVLLSLAESIFASRYLARPAEVREVRKAAA